MARFSKLPWILDTVGERTPNLDILIRTGVTRDKKIKVEKVVLFNTTAGALTVELADSDATTILVSASVPAAALGADGQVTVFFNEAWLDGFEATALPAGTTAQIYLASPDVSPQSHNV